MEIQRDYNYSDIYLVPQERVVNSRSECNVKVILGERTFSNPVIAANMKTVVDEDTCTFLASRGMFYIMHRYHTLGNSQLGQFILDSQKKFGFASISLGVQDVDKQTVKYFNKYHVCPDFITIDVAHAHAPQVSDMVKFVKKTLPTFLIVGNVATAEGVTFLEDAGADCVKLGLGNGSSCTTRLKTGFTRGIISCLLECACIANIPLIADGGVKQCGDITKAMVCGATMVMAGMFMCAFDESPGEVMKVNGELKYLYYGSASYNMKRNNKHVEGTERLIPYKGSMAKHIEDIECSLRSACSYGGVQKITEMYDRSIPMITFK